jgi:hypothetical protein
VPYDKDGKFYTTRIEDDDLERLTERTMNAMKYGKMGMRLGKLAPHPAVGVAAGALGAIGGFILGDQETVFPVDMIAIPAYQAYLIQGNPAFQIYIKEGEVLTQVIPTDAMEATAIVDDAPMEAPKKKRAPSSWNKYCAKASNQIKFKSGKKKGLLNLKAMGVQYRKANKSKASKKKKKGGRK